MLSNYTLDKLLSSKRIFTVDEFRYLYETTFKVDHTNFHYYIGMYLKNVGGIF